MRGLQFLFALFFVSTAAFAECNRAQHLRRRASSLKVMSYNVENLFDTVDDPNTSDEEFTPGGRQAWTERVVADKIKNLGEIIKNENPDVVGIVEVENEAMLGRLVREGLASQGYKFYVAGPSQDVRGIRNGVISKFPIVSVKSHQVWRDTWVDNGVVYKTRDILEVTVNTLNCSSSSLVTVLVNHWPSRRNGALSERFRLEASEQMNTIVREIVSANPGRLVLSIGDFNDEIRDNSFQQALTLVPNLRELARAEPGAFFAIDSQISAGPTVGTFYFARDRVWNFLDHILVAGGRDLVNGRGYSYREGSIKIVRSRFVEEGLYPKGCEIFRNQRRETCPDGASDHFPISAIFDYR